MTEWVKVCGRETGWERPQPILTESATIWQLNQKIDSVEFMSKTIRFFIVLLFFIMPVMSGCRAKQIDPTGSWSGTVRNPSGEDVAFTLEVSREGDDYRGTLRNGESRTVSTGGSWDGKRIRLAFDYYDGELTATIDGDTGDTLRGQFIRQWQKKTLTREMVGSRDKGEVRAGAGIPAGAAVGGPLTGDWVLAVGIAPAQRYWRATLRQDGSSLIGTIIPVSGDWGQLSGSVTGDGFVISNFDGINSRLLKGRIRPDGRFEGIVDLGLFDPVRPVVGERLDGGNAASVANLPDPNNYTRLANPAEPFRFAFPDLSGKIIAATDERFRNRVQILSITGSWCPNCHEEAPLLQEYYDKYHSRGLDVVALAFEYTGDPARDLEKLKIFGERHHLTYPLLLAGTTEDGDVAKKLPQLVNFGAYPTTIFIGRDGLVKRIHTGFEGKATGERHTRLKAEYVELIETLLAE